VVGGMGFVTGERVGDLVVIAGQSRVGSLLSEVVCRVLKRQGK
jgi:hypothetical protein